MFIAEAPQQIGHWDEAFLEDDWGHRLYSGRLLIGNPRANFNLTVFVHALAREETEPFIEIPFVPYAYSPIPDDFLLPATSTYFRDKRIGIANLRELRRQELIGPKTPTAEQLKTALDGILAPLTDGLRIFDRFTGARISHGLTQEKYPYNKDLSYQISLTALAVNQQGDGWYRYPDYPVLKMAREIQQQSHQQMRLLPQPL